MSLLSISLLALASGPASEPRAYQGHHQCWDKYVAFHVHTIRYIILPTVQSLYFRLCTFFYYVFAFSSHFIMSYFKTFFYNIHWRLAGVLRFLFLRYHLLILSGSYFVTQSKKLSSIFGFFNCWLPDCCCRFYYKANMVELKPLQPKSGSFKKNIVRANIR